MEGKTMKVKTTKVVLTVISIVVVVTGFSVMKFTGVWDFIFSKDINEKNFIKVIKNPIETAEFTIFLHINDASHDAFSSIYIIPGRCEEKNMLKNNNYLKFPDSTGISWEWIDNDNLRLYTSKKPEINNFTSEEVKIELVIGRQKINELEAEGKEVIWYEIK